MKLILLLLILNRFIIANVKQIIDMRVEIWLEPIRFDWNVLGSAKNAAWSSTARDIPPNI